ncbi:MAG: hypothetical protein AAB353_07480, partial [Candidatus Hydrogenedentota bacterium]
MTNSRLYALRLLFATIILAKLCAVSFAQNVPGDEPNRGGVLDLSAQDPAIALERLHVAGGYEVNLFASEVDFPIEKPVAIAFDAKGRLWVPTMPSSPQRLPDEAPADKL